MTTLSKEVIQKARDRGFEWLGAEFFVKKGQTYRYDRDSEMMVIASADELDVLEEARKEGAKEGLAGFEKDEFEEVAGKALQEIAEQKRLEEADPKKVLVRDLSEDLNIPPGFILVFEDTTTGRLSPYVVKEGIYYKLNQKGYQAVQTHFTLVDDEKHTYEAVTKIYPKLTMEQYKVLSTIAEKGDREWFLKALEEFTRPTIHSGRASPVTLKEKQQKWAKDMAETRATLRCARVYTGCGLYTKEEIDEGVE